MMEVLPSSPYSFALAFNDIIITIFIIILFFTISLIFSPVAMYKGYDDIRIIFFRLLFVAGFGGNVLRFF